MDVAWSALRDADVLIIGLGGMLHHMAIEQIVMRLIYFSLK